MKKQTLDRSRPFATLSSLSQDPNRAVAEQDGILFGQDDKEVGKTDGFHLRKQKEEAAEAQAAATAEESAAERAAAVLGGLGDPDQEAQRENAAAANAESLSDDAEKAD